LLELIDNTTPQAQRATAEWIAGWTLAKVGLEDDVRAVSVTAQFGQGQPTTLGPAQALVLENQHRMAHFRATDPSRRSRQGEQEMHAAYLQELALMALRYTTADPLAAALGAVDCLWPFMPQRGTRDAEGRPPGLDISGQVDATTELLRPLLTGTVDHTRAPD
jgi:hypothetical protein